MMNNLRTRLLIAPLLALASSAAMAYTVDGDLSDWGVTATGSSYDWYPDSGIYYKLEDSHNTINPGGGGQTYDAEAIYLDWDSTTLYYAVVTGRSQYESVYPSGDIAIDFGQDNSYEFGIETRGNNGFSQGDLVTVSTWAIANPYPQSGVTEIVAGTVESNNDFVYTTSAQYNIGYWSGDGHYVMEGSISLEEFALYAGQSFSIHWTMGCGNDEIVLNVNEGLPSVDNGGGGSSVPIPGTGLLMGGALLGWMGYRRRGIAAKPVEQDDAEH